MGAAHSRGEAVLVVTTTTFVLASLFVAARLISRFAILRSRTADDWFMIVAWVSRRNAESSRGMVLI